MPLFYLFYIKNVSNFRCNKLSLKKDLKPNPCQGIGGNIEIKVSNCNK